MHELEPFDLEFCPSETMRGLGHAWKLQNPGLQVLEEFIPVYHVCVLLVAM